MHGKLQSFVKKIQALPGLGKFYSIAKSSIPNLINQNASEHSSF